jgi:hypothetical protein
MFDYTVKDSPMTKRSYFTNKDNNSDILIFDTNPQFQYTVHCHDKNRA